MQEAWFRRLADVPGIDYVAEISVDRTKLWGHNAKPRNKYSDHAWPRREGGTTYESPATQWRPEPRPGESQARTALRGLCEALELPGTIRVYRFAISTCCDTLWQQRHTEPWVAYTIERLCWLEISLYETHCEGLDVGTFAYSMLVEMYSREGYLHEALALLQRAQLKHTTAWVQSEYKQLYEELQKRMAALEAEGAS